jgi:hypothetical protein
METKNQTIASAEGQPDNMEQPGRTEFLAYQQQVYSLFYLPAYFILPTIPNRLFYLLFILPTLLWN